MKTIKVILVILGILIAGLLLGRFTAPRHAADHEPAAGASTAATVYTCSMHPQIRQPKPGKCPICAMDLIPASQSDAGGTAEREVSLTPYARALARIATTPVHRGFPDAEIRLLGRIMPDESLVRSITARFPARIDRLYVNYTGIHVQPGDHLALIYSPELLTAQAEFLSARRHSDERALRSARDKLALWGFSEQAIAGIESSGKLSDTMDINAPLGGFVTDKMVSEGDYVETGEAMFKITDLRKLWVVLDTYERDLPWLRFGQPVHFTAEALPGREFTGRIAFIPPTIDAETRTFKVRVNVDNDDLLLRPGMFLSGVVHAGLAADGVVLDADLAGKWISPMHPEIVKDGPGSCDVCGMDLVPAEELGYIAGSTEPPITIPASAVLRTGRRAIVYVEVPDREDPTYEGREIALGPRAGDLYIVASGLREGERVVTHGAFKLDSALQLLAKPSMMSPEGGGPVPGHDHGGETRPSRHQEPLPDITSTPELRNAVSQLAAAYLPLWKTLSGDDLEASRAAAETLEHSAHQFHGLSLPEAAKAFFDEETGEIARAATAVADAGNINDARAAFEKSSDALIRLVKAAGLPEGTTLYQAHCPMAFGGRRAEWLQDTDAVLNPYFGAAMLHCGEIDAKLEGSPQP